MPWYWPFGRKPVDNKESNADELYGTTVKSADGKTLIEYDLNDDNQLVRHVTQIPDDGGEDLGTATGEDFVDPSRR